MGRSSGLPILMAALLAVAGCGPAERRGSAPEGPPLDMEGLRLASKALQQYVEALVLCNSPIPADWNEALRQLEAVRGLRVFEGDAELLRRFRGGDEAARRELGRRGTMLQSAEVFTQKYDHRKWDEARKTLLGMGDDGSAWLATTLLRILLNGQWADQWLHVRYTLAETGEIGLKLTEGLARHIASVTPSTPIFKLDDLTQVTLALQVFGAKGRPCLEELARYREPNVRRAVARAMGDSADQAVAPILARMLAEDSEYGVRWAAATALGKMGASRAVAGPALVGRIGKEPNPHVLRAALESIGQVGYIEAIPDLVRVLDVPSHETRQSAMTGLYDLTGERLTRPEQWRKWYQESYAAWKRKRRSP